MKHFQLVMAVSAISALGACGEVATTAPPSEADGWSINHTGDLNNFFDCLDQAGLALISAHRGGPAPNLPENALETLQATMANMPATMEIDVAQSSDGVLFLMHDDTLDRTTNGAGVAAEQPWREISALRLEDEDGRLTDFAPPRFADVLAWAKPRTILQIDFKRSARYENVIDEIYHQDAEDRVVLIAYSMASAERLHRLAPDMMISISVASQSDLNRAVAAGVPENRLIAFTGTEAPQQRLLTLLDRRDVEGVFGTLGGRSSIDAEIARFGNEARYAEIAGMGADIIATDRPQAAHQALADAGRAPADGVCGVVRN